MAINTSQPAFVGTLFNYSAQDLMGHCGTCGQPPLFTFNETIEPTPVITLNLPVDTFNSSSQTINFNGSVVGGDGVTNVSLFIDGIINETNSSGINDTDYLFTKVIAEGSHNWTYEACNVNGCGSATVRTFDIDSIAPNITSNASITFEFQRVNTNLYKY
jgi:hypothetical protein